MLQFEIFKAIFETGSFTKASETLMLTQSAISHAVAALENDLNLTLFNRNRTGVTLTDSGEKILIHVQKILA